MPAERKHLLVRLLRSGILEDGLCSPNSEGAPQGSVISPLLSNIYLHYVLDLWFEKRASKSLRGEGYLFRYAADFVVCLQYPGEGNRLRRDFEERLKKFSLEVAADKTAMLPFGRFEEESARKAGRKPGSFVFLGFRFVCGKSRKGFFKVKRITAGSRLRRCLIELKHWLSKHYAWMRKGDLIRAVRLEVVGDLNHFAITDNLKRSESYLFFARRLLFRALSRKSQKRPYTWAGFMAALQYAKWPDRAKLVHDIDPMRRRTVQQSLEGYKS